MNSEEMEYEFDFADGFIEGYLTGMMMGQAYQSEPCEKDDCPR